MSASPLHPALPAVPDFSADIAGYWRERAGKKAALLRQVAQSEKLSAVRPASMLEIRPQPEMVSSGVAALDAMSGGLPRGCLSEISGAASSGKTSVMLAAISSATRRQEICVLIDAGDAFDPASGHSAGIDLRKLLWVRCGERAAASAARSKKSGERRLEQMLKAADLILQSGGFGLIVLDLAGVADKFVRRIPLASWFRFQRAIEHTRSVLLVMSQTPCAQTCATTAIVIRQSPFSIPQSTGPTHAEILERINSAAEVTRSRLERKPVQSVKASFAARAVRFG